MNGATADFISTLETMVDDIENDGTSIACNTFDEEAHLKDSDLA